MQLKVEERSNFEDFAQERESEPRLHPWILAQLGQGATGTSLNPLPEAGEKQEQPPAPSQTNNSDDIGSSSYAQSEKSRKSKNTVNTNADDESDKSVDEEIRKLMADDKDDADSISPAFLSD